MKKIDEIIGFLEMLKSLNKTVVEIDLINNKLLDIKNDSLKNAESLRDKIIILPDESDMMNKRYREYNAARKNVEKIDPGSFYSGFRRSWAWLKTYEKLED